MVAGSGSEEEERQILVPRILYHHSPPLRLCDTELGQVAVLTIQTWRLL